MAIESNRRKYLHSLALELQSQATRVRDLIGSRHWLSDGHHKEYILLSLLSRYLPSGVIASRGFVVSPHNTDECSTEQDILLVDVSREAPIFNQGSLIIAFPRQVIASVSVKTTLQQATVQDSLQGLATVRKVLHASNAGQKVWYGAYFFESESRVESNPSLVYDWIARTLTNNGINHNSQAPIGFDLLACCSTIFCRAAVDYFETLPKSVYLNGFKCGDLATALFLGHLLDCVAIWRGATEGELLNSLDDWQTEPFAEPRRDLT